MDNESKTYKLHGSRVYGHGKSFNCVNVATAKELQGILNTYEATLIRNKEIEQQYDNITKQIIQIQLSIGIVTEEIQKLKETIECMSQ